MMRNDIYLLERKTLGEEADCAIIQGPSQKIHYFGPMITLVNSRVISGESYQIIDSNVFRWRTHTGYKFQIIGRTNQQRKETASFSSKILKAKLTEIKDG